MSEVDHDRLGVPRSLLAILLAILAFDVSMPIAFPLTYSIAPEVEMAYVAFLLAQAGLHAALVVLWQGWLRVRMASLPLLSILALLHLSQENSTAIEQSLPLLVILWVLVAVAMLGIGTMGWELQRRSPQQLKTANPRRPQITLLGLGILVTVACILAAVLIQFDWRYGTSDLLLPVVFATQTVAVFTGVLLPRQKTWMVVVSLAVALAVGGLWMLLGFLGGIHFQAGILIVITLPSFLQTLFLLAMRRMGYRLWRIGPISGELPSEQGAQV